MHPDVIVVGAGSGGCILTRRLLDAGARVLLLEAGGADTSPLVRAPAAFPKLFRTPFDWAFHTVPQPHAGGRSFFWPRGRVLGGSSAINATIYIRGSQRDFDAWGEGWTWADVLPAFRDLETYSGDPAGTRGEGGGLPVGHRHASHPLSHAFVQSAGAALGVPVVGSFNDGNLQGAGLYESNHLRGERYSAFRAFLQPVLHHPNLTVRTGVRALKVLLDHGRATGVRVRRADGVTEDLRGGAVALTAGAVQTPHLLLLSGIGARHALTRHGVDVHAHVPGVGEGLQDHLAVPVIFRSTQPSLNERLTPPALAGAFAEWFARRSGPLTSNLAEAGAFTRTHPDLPDPDIQFHFGPLYFRDHGFQLARGPHFSVGPVLVDVHSRGRLTLASSDPTTAPLIDPNYLADERDVDALVRGVALAREIARTGELGRANGGEVLPAHPDTVHHVRHEAATLYHPVGTARLGDDDGAAVDRQLRVRNVPGLWVADASVMPRIIHANTNATAMMIGARAADFIARA
ncbi:GMC family oxidoreductase [Deinococcus maricopensis]|uniref:Choline dehydrogenase n=1 Tax=Deinococcus maricopensis (strain DSM 21211 / LMG 22137 / NRRL B-23946 / LB-34) TaxID=709986 RepID=E8U860_DEIML|nr:GMC family oxidoreductase N-terminal domain-containing protein [Deinococcus maricopensis]ADV67249.1 Choline dehydrogenase [Deinococcus maricopensis DSM 21211]